jgi:tyrosine-protein kinase Etk/Wzc
MEVSAAADAALGKAKDTRSATSYLKLTAFGRLMTLRQKISKEKNNVNLNFDAGSGLVRSRFGIADN